jgi:hypothetical protein
MKKRNRESFAKKANALIERLGAEPVDEWYPWRLKTKAGMLSLRVEFNELRNHGPGTVFTRFDSPPDAKCLTDCNPHSGKWNHHFFDGWTVEDALKHLEFQLRGVL